MDFKRANKHGVNRESDSVLTCGSRESRIQEFIEALRSELIEYGEMLVLLEQQQKFILARAAEQLLENVGCVQVEMWKIAEARERRCELSVELAELFFRTTPLSFAELFERLPKSHQPLVRALVAEINDLLFHCQQRLLQNSLLLQASGVTVQSSRTHRELVCFGLN